VLLPRGGIAPPARQRSRIALTHAARRAADMVARYGGEEFAVLLPNSSGDDAMHVARRILDDVRSLGIPHAETSHGIVTVSLGAVSLAPSKRCVPADLVRQAAQDQIATINGITSQTLGFARTPFKPKSSDLVVLAEAVLRIHQRAIEAKNIHLVKSLPEGVVAAVHPGEILQVVSNIIVNAVDALPDDGTLTIRLRKASTRVHLLISDNGHGIPTENTARIFEPFFTTKEDRGTGLGLALSKRIIERHGGSIWVRSSTRPGNSGTTFRISLPAPLNETPLSTIQCDRLAGESVAPTA
jgi:signal transduction histidine kinase